MQERQIPVDVAGRGASFPSRLEDRNDPAIPGEGAYQPINAYGVIGNCHSAILVAADGSIDWGCLPDFDSPAIFCRLLDAEQGGYFQLAPADITIPGVQSYLPGSNVLQTRFSSLAGEIVVTDFMPVQTLDALAPAPTEHAASSCLVRRLTCTYGQLTVKMQLKVTPQYASASNTITRVETHTGLVISGGEQYVGLYIGGATHLPSFSLKVEWSEDDVQKAHPQIVAQWRISPGDELFFVLGTAKNALDTYQMVKQEFPNRDFQQELEQTLHCWHRWLTQCTYDGPYKEAVQRSALTLKLLTYAPTGAIVAAPTTSLPEALGEGRNWDYRYTWLRDASFTLTALSRLGFIEETYAFMNWLCDWASIGDGEPQIMYGIHGEHDLPEYQLDHLSGYCNSYPVRVGNEAARQKQLDIFGELLDCIAFSYFCSNGEQAKRYLSPHLWRKLCQLVEYVCIHWQEPDSGIWEVRGGPQHYVYSKVMCWVALDRAIQLAEHAHMPADLPRWRRIRDQIRLNVLTRGYNTQIKAFTQAYGKDGLDAACLFLPLVGFIPAHDPRMHTTIERIMQELTDEHSFVYRYHTDDGLTGNEGTFLLCTFWLVDNLALSGRVTEAQTIFERLIRCTGKLGLFAEEFDATNNQALGNYPQAFSHLALIHSALNLQRAAKRQALSQGGTPLVAAIMLEK